MLEDLYNNRTTTRVYKQDPLPLEDINSIVNAALSAPSKNCIYPYRIDVYTQSDFGKAAKQHLYRNVCTTEWNTGLEDQPVYDFDRSQIKTSQIKMTQCLNQIRAPITLAFIGEFVSDKSNDKNFFDLKENFNKYTLKEVLLSGDTEIAARVIRDCMLACSWAQLRAQELGYDTSFVGIAGQHDNELVNQCEHIDISDNESIIILLCIGHATDDINLTPRCVAEEYNYISDDITEVVFYEKTREGQWEVRGCPVPDINYV